MLQLNKQHVTAGAAYADVAPAAAPVVAAAATLLRVAPVNWALKEEKPMQSE